MTLRLSRLLLALALIVLAAPLVVSPAANTASAAADGATTVEGNWHRWIPNAKKVDDPDFGPYWTGRYDDATPSVTVDRTTNLTDEVVNVSWRNFTPTSNDPAYADFETGKPPRTPFRVDDSGTSQYYGVEIYQCRGTRPTVNPSDNGRLSDPRRAECYDSSVFTPFDGQYGQNNRVPASTQNDGTGFAQFHVENALSNDLLGCSAEQACSIVVVPTVGGMWDQGDLDNKSTDGCDDHSADFVQPPEYSFLTNANVSSTSSPCNWAKRIVVPLSFAPIAAGCPDSTTSFNAAGSPPLRRALNQLAAGWCRDSQPVTFGYNFSSTEADAGNRFLAGSSGGLTSDVDVALTSQPVDVSTGARPFRYAPIANDAVAIPYLVDNPRTGRPITDLRLSARLVAKLLTQSYSPLAWNCKADKVPWCEPGISDNPTSPFDDPEFQKLNFRGDHSSRADFPSASGADPTTGTQLNNGGFFPSVAAGDSDLTYALTRWIASDPDASDFLNGRADQWGMRINPNYRVSGQTLYPTTQFQAQDPGYTAPQGAPADGERDNRYWQGMQGSWNPLAALSQVALTMVRNRSTASGARGECYDSSGAVGACPDVAILPIQFKRTPPEPNGARSLTGVTDLTDARAYGLPTADLVTQQGKTVEPSTASVGAAVSAFTENRDGVTGSLDFAKAPDGAYPLALPVYAMVPTCGLTKTKAAGIKRMLGKVVSSQAYGDTPGKLARGLVTLTSAQLADTRRAAAEVSTRSCSPARAGTGPRSGNGGNRGDSADGGTGGSGGGFGGGAGGGLGGAGGGGSQGPGTSANGPAAGSTPKPSSGSSSKPNAATKNVGFPIDDDGGGVSLLPIVLLIGALLLLGGPTAWWALATAPGRTFRDKARHLVVGTPWGRRG